MKLAQWLLAAMALTITVLVAGCGDKKTTGGTVIKQDSAKEVFETFCLAGEKMDMDALAAIIHPDYAKPMSMMAGCFNQFKNKTEELAKAVEAKVGKDEAKKIRKGIEAMNDSGAGKKAMKDGKVDWSKVKIEEKGDTATATIEGENKPLKLVKVKGKWYADPNEEKMDAKKMQAQADEMKKMFDAQLPKMDELIKKVKDGKVTKENFEKEVMDAMGSMM